MCLSNPYLSVAVRMCVLYAFCMVVPDTFFDVFCIFGSSRLWHSLSTTQKDLK